jgi:hypothetical protein
VGRADAVCRGRADRDRLQRGRRAIRHLALTRKNALFAGPDDPTSQCCST